MIGEEAGKKCDFYSQVSVLLSHVLLMMESLGGCRAVRSYYSALAGHESPVHVHSICFFLKTARLCSYKH